MSKNWKLEKKRATIILCIWLSMKTICFISRFFFVLRLYVVYHDSSQYLHDMTPLVRILVGALILTLVINKISFWSLPETKGCLNKLFLTPLAGVTTNSALWENKSMWTKFGSIAAYSTLHRQEKETVPQQGKTLAPIYPFIYTSIYMQQKLKSFGLWMDHRRWLKDLTQFEKWVMEVQWAMPQCCRCFHRKQSQRGSTNGPQHKTFHLNVCHGRWMLVNGHWRRVCWDYNWSTTQEWTSQSNHWAQWPVGPYHISHSGLYRA